VVLLTMILSITTSEILHASGYAVYAMSPTVYEQRDIECVLWLLSWRNLSPTGIGNVFYIWT